MFCSSVPDYLYHWQIAGVASSRQPSDLGLSEIFGNTLWPIFCRLSKIDHASVAERIILASWDLNQEYSPAKSLPACSWSVTRPLFSIGRRLSQSNIRAGLSRWVTWRT
jgi:hypothetical protein